MLQKSLIDSWSFFNNHAISISIIILPIVVPIYIFTALYDYFLLSEEFVLYEHLIPLVINLIAYPVYAAGVVFYIASVVSGGSIDAKTSWKLGIKYWLPYVIMSLLVGIAVMGGFILLIIPGIILAARYAFSQFDLLLNQSKPLEAIRNSWEATRDYMWVIFSGYVVITLVLYVPYFLITSLFEESSVLYMLIDTTSDIIYSVLGALYTIFAFRIYESARLQYNQSLNQNTP